jgi:hypothetical protein
LPICNIPISHREERSRFDKLKAPSLSRGDVAIHAPDDVDCHARQPGSQ